MPQIIMPGRLVSWREACRQARLHGSRRDDSCADRLPQRLLSISWPRTLDAPAAISSRSGALPSWIYESASRAVHASTLGLASA